MAGNLFGGETERLIHSLLFFPEGKNMRTLAVTFFFFVLLFGFASLVLSSDLLYSQDKTGNEYLLGQISALQQTTNSIISVDREDDPLILTPCTSAPNDCTLRGAINLANTDDGPTEITFSGNLLIRLVQPLPPLTADNTSIIALKGQEVHIDGHGVGGSVLRITGPRATVEGLRIYGAGTGYPNVVISEGAYHVVIANNVIGDDDAPYGNCGSSDQAYSGIYVEGSNDIGSETRAWIYGNVIECHHGYPGDGIILLSGNVIIGKDPNGASASSQSNIIRDNRGFGVNLRDTTGNTVCDNQFVANESGDIFLNNFLNNNVMFNEMVQNANDTNLG